MHILILWTPKLIALRLKLIAWTNWLVRMLIAYVCFQNGSAYLFKKGVGILQNKEST